MAIFHCMSNCMKNYHWKQFKCWYKLGLMPSMSMITKADYLAFSSFIWLCGWGNCLVHSWPESCQVPTKEDELALHMACRYQSSALIRFLLDCFPQAVHHTIFIRNYFTCHLQEENHFWLGVFRASCPCIPRVNLNCLPIYIEFNARDRRD